MAFAKDANGLWLFKKKLPFRFRERTFIVPTPFGFAFGAMAFVMLFMAIGYANNLIYIYVFALISVCISSMYLTNRNVERVNIQSLDLDFAFAGEETVVGASLQNFSQQDSFRLVFCFVSEFPQDQWIHSIHEILPARQKGLVAVKWRAERRGKNVLPRLRMQSHFPFGILRAWKFFSSPEEIIVYPARVGVTQFPLSASSGNEQGNLGLFRDHRPYQSTDSPRRVDWRATAKFQTLLVKNFEGAEQSSLHFDWEQTASVGDFEARLSQMSLWVSQAHDLGVFYSIQLGGFQSETSHGAGHFRKCMERLALLDPRDLS